MNEFLIGNVKISKDTTINDFKKRNVFEINEMDEVVMIDSSPNTLDFIGGKYWVEIFFYNGVLEEIKLYPFINGVSASECLPEEYEKICFDYNHKLLVDAYGKPNEEKENLIAYEDSYFTLSCFKYIDSRDFNPSGYIKIAISN